MAIVFSIIKIFIALGVGMSAVIGIGLMVVTPAVFLPFGYFTVLISSLSSLIVLIVYEVNARCQFNHLNYKFFPILRMFFLTSLIVYFLVKPLISITVLCDGPTLTARVLDIRLLLECCLYSGVVGAVYYLIHKLGTKVNTP